MFIKIHLKFAYLLRHQHSVSEINNIGFRFFSILLPSNYRQIYTVIYLVVRNPSRSVCNSNLTIFSTIIRLII
jgi:hypothetical protein